VPQRDVITRAMDLGRSIIKGINYNNIRMQIEEFLVELQGVMLALDLTSYRSRLASDPPPMTIGRGAIFNRGVYVNSIAARVAPQLIYNPRLVLDGDLDRRRGPAATQGNPVSTYRATPACLCNRVQNGDGAGVARAQRALSDVQYRLKSCRQVTANLNRMRFDRPFRNGSTVLRLT
jgi:hypothetical protein